MKVEFQQYRLFKQRQAFTLIELLVVISILGILASVVLISMEGATDQAEQKKAMEFSHTVRVSLGADLVGEWTFDDGTARDSSGYDNNGAVVGDPIQIDGIFGDAMEFDGTDDRIDCGSSFDLPTAFTIETWVKPDVYGSLDYVVWRNDDRPGIRMGNNKWLLMVDGNNGNSIYSTSNVTIGVWTHLVLTFDGTVSRAYVNGTEENSKNDSTYTQGTTFSIGGDANPDRRFHGKIDEVRIYNRALSSAEIEKHYTQGAVNHNIVLK